MKQAVRRATSVCRFVRMQTEPTKRRPFRLHSVGCIVSMFNTNCSERNAKRTLVFTQVCYSFVVTYERGLCHAAVDCIIQVSGAVGVSRVWLWRKDGFCSKSKSFVILTHVYVFHVCHFQVVRFLYVATA